MKNGNDHTIYELLRMRAEQDPEAVAIGAPGRNALTYRGLLAQVDSLVRSLINMGVQRNDRIAIVLPNGPEMAVAFLGVAAGAVCAPLNPAYSRSEFEFYLADVSPKALIVQYGNHSVATDVAEKYGIPVIEVLTNAEQAAGTVILRGNGQAVRLRVESAQADDVALILHTSGTTSRPKIVPLTHTNLLASAGNITATLRLSRADCCFNIMPLFHIHGLVGALLSSVMAGASIICSPGFDVGRFFSWLEAFRPTWYTAVPTIHHEVLSGARTGGALSRSHSLRFIRSSSAALPARVLQDLEKTFKVPVIESYGMTEAAHQMTSNPLPPLQRKIGSVGMAAGPEVAIMDEAGNPLSTGAIGEIVIRGANVTRGYDNNSAANAAAFKDLWFRTGDQGYLDADGYLFITGRLKEIINRGGEKISPREVDEALLDHPDISQAIAFAVPHATLGEDVGAAIVMREKQQTTEADIREYLGSRLAAYKIPSRILFVDDLPKGATGKIQRIELAKKFADQLNGKFVTLQNELESAVAGIYAEVLGVEQVGATDNFFALGGDSLRATQVIARISARFDVNVSIATIFLQSTVRELAQELLQLIAATDEDSATRHGART
jgi:acyl-CoA synthetase (AMP-forming)/AMP-acid ligase II/acyl carrier protein